MKKRKCNFLFMEIIGLSILTFIINLFTPLVDDDLYLPKNINLNYLIKSATNDYFGWNGRVVGQSIWRLLVAGNGFVSSVLISFSTVLLIILMTKFSSNKINPRSFLQIVILFILFVPVIGQTLFWRAGVGNYLFTTLLTFIFLNRFINWFRLSSHSAQSTSIHTEKILMFLKSVLFILVSILAGWSNENTSGGVLLLVCLYMLLGKFKLGLRLQKWQFYSIFFYIMGYIGLLIAPGNALRTKATMPATWFTEPLYSRFITGVVAVTKSLLIHYSLLLIAIIVLFIILLFIYKVRLNKLMEPIAWAFSGFATIYVLSFSPMGQDGGRSFFGGILMSIICLNMLFEKVYVIVSDGQNTKLLHRGLKLLAIIAAAYACIGIVDSVKTNSALLTRYSYLDNLTTKQRNNEIIKVKKLNYYPKTKFSVTYGLSDLGNNPKGFPNLGYNYFWDLKKGIVEK